MFALLDPADQNECRSMRIRIQNTDFSGAAIWVELVAVFVDEWSFYDCPAT
jgi:hypothetical protein